MHRRSLFFLTLMGLCVLGDSSAARDAGKPAHDAPEKQHLGAKRTAAGSQNTAAEPPEVKQTAREGIARATKKYWRRCIEINKRFLSDKSEIWFKELRPSSIERICRETAEGLRRLSTRDVDPQVIDHVNRAIRGYEEIGAIAKIKGRQSLTSDAAHALKFAYLARSMAVPGLVAGGGWVEMGLGLSPEGRKATSEGQAQSRRIASSIMKFEEAIIQAMRKKYGIELKPW